LKKNNSHVLCFLIRFLGFLFFFRKKYTKTLLSLFLLHHAISPSSELHNNNFLCLLRQPNLTEKKCTPSLFSQGVVAQITPKW